MREIGRLGLRAIGLALAALMASGCGGGDDSSAPSSPALPGTGGGNAPPTIQGKPGGSVLPGESYSFQPSANDSDDDTLTFSVSNLPSWASFNASTGRLSGMPTEADLATYGGITITVSDGTATASLGPFSITVSDVGSGAATLSWAPPTQNIDGSALRDLAGYQILYGRDEGDLSRTITLDNPSLNTYMVENLSSGTWYFAVIAVTAGGLNSPLSNVASKTIG